MVLDAPRAPRLVAAAKSAAERRRNSVGSIAVLVVRQTALRGPCGDAPQGSRDRRAFASATGSRAPWRACGCSAGRCACSRLVSPVVPRIKPATIAWSPCGFVARRPLYRQHPIERMLVGSGGRPVAISTDQTGSTDGPPGAGTTSSVRIRTCRRKPSLPESFPTRRRRCLPSACHLWQGHESC